MTQTIILARHGRTEWNVQKRIQGHQGRDLDEVGREQATEMRDRLLKELTGIDTIMSSDLPRAMQTAQIVAGVFGREVRTDKRLRECGFGVLEGLTHEEAVEQHGIAVTTHLKFKETDGDYDLVQYGGECRSRVIQRQVELINEILSDNTVTTVLFIGHGRSLNSLLSTFWPQQPAIVDNCQYRVVAPDPILVAAPSF